MVQRKILEDTFTLHIYIYIYIFILSVIVIIIILIILITLPETNSWPSLKGISSSNQPFSRAFAVSLREGDPEGHPVIPPENSPIFFSACLGGPNIF